MHFLRSPISDILLVTFQTQPLAFLSPKTLPLKREGASLAPYSTFKPVYLPRALRASGSFPGAP